MPSSTARISGRGSEGEGEGRGGRHGQAGQPFMHSSSSMRSSKAAQTHSRAVLAAHFCCRNTPEHRFSETNKPASENYQPRSKNGRPASPTCSLTLPLSNTSSLPILLLGTSLRLAGREAATDGPAPFAPGACVGDRCGEGQRRVRRSREQRPASDSSGLPCCHLAADETAPPNTQPALCYNRQHSARTGNLTCWATGSRAGSWNSIRRPSFRSTSCRKDISSI